MNKQEYFDLLEKTSLEGKFPAVQKNFDNVGGTRCVYRSPEGNMCAFGLLIPDEQYDSSLEGLLVDEIIPEFLTESIIPEGMTLEDLKEIQRSHDSQVLSICGRKWNHERFMADIRPIFN